MKPIAKILLAAAMCSGSTCLGQQPKFEPNYDEAKIPAYELPEILDASLDTIESVKRGWPEQRSQLLAAFTEQMYGKAPTSEYSLTCTLVESGKAFKDKALRQQFAVTITTESGTQRIDLLVHTPAIATAPVACFLGLNFRGNHTVTPDPQVLIPSSWSPNDAKAGATDNTANETGRGTSASRWAIESIVDAGLGVATAYCGDVDPDYDDGFANGVHALFPENRPSSEHPDRWGTVAAWAWGLSRCLDCIQTDIKQIDGQRVCVLGHSRLGKTALWAGATDPRFAAVISNNSGCGGAALSRRAIGETVWRINNSFPHWFCGNFKQYDNSEASLPFDQHQLVALIAPRPVYVASASEDKWADPKGEFLSAKLASELYQRLGGKALSLPDFPGPDTAEVGQVSYHLRGGPHNITEWDWQHYIRFLKQIE
jgi:hypothetical protein